MHVVVKAGVLEQMVHRVDGEHKVAMVRNRFESWTREEEDGGCVRKARKFFRHYPASNVEKDSLNGVHVLGPVRIVDYQTMVPRMDCAVEVRNFVE